MFENPFAIFFGFAISLFSVIGMIVGILWILLDQPEESEIN